MSQSGERRFALITGCGKGSIGESLAREFTKHGLSVIATVLPGEDSQHLVLPNCHPHELDVTSDESVARLYKSVQELNGGRIDVLGNNAGIGYLYPAVDSDLDMTQKLFDVHVLGSMRMVKKFHKCLVKTRGVIFNTCSITSLFPTPWSGSYGAAKAALYHYGEILRVELAPLGVRVVNVLTGEVRTNILKPLLDQSINQDSVMAPMNARFRESLPGAEPRMAPEKFAQGVVPRILAKNPGRDCWYGTRASMIWFLYTWLPKSVMDMLATSVFHLNELKPRNV